MAKQKVNKAKKNESAKLAAKKKKSKESNAFMTTDTLVFSLTPEMKRSLRKTMLEKGNATFRIEELEETSIGVVLRAYPVIDPPN